jgi:hypothetical protein
MIYLDPNLPAIVEARNNHLDKLFPKIKVKIDALHPGELKTFFNDLRIKEILIDLPGKLESHHTALLNTLNDYSVAQWNEYIRIKKSVAPVNRSNIQKDLIVKYNTFTLLINDIFKYTGGFARKKSPYSAYNLASNLNIQTCVYCNRLYTKTVKNPSKITRPEFDHWYPKESYPLLALSFYNLLPSCHVCNSSVKGSEVMSLDDYIHPYVDKNINFKFSYWVEKYNKYDFRIKSAPNSKEENTIKAFKLEEIYKTHQDEIHDMVRLRSIYSINYLTKLKKLLNKEDQNISMDEIYRLAFGTHLKESKFHKRPLSRMKRDILEELGIIKLEKE